MTSPAFFVLLPVLCYACYAMGYVRGQRHELEAWKDWLRRKRWMQ